MSRKYLFPLLIVLMFSSINFAQNLDGKFKFVYADWDDYDFDDWSTDRHPFMEVNYGFSDVKHKKFSGDFLQLGFGELKLGYSSHDTYFENYLLEFDDNYFVVSNFSKELASEEDALKNEVGIWRFGIGNRDGYGYRFGDMFAILPYHENSMMMTRIKASDYDSLGVLAQYDDIANENYKILERYHDGFRFGTTSAAGLKLQFAGTFSINASYEGSVVFPRYMVWLHMGSAVIEMAGHQMIDYFVDEVIDSSPAAGPVVNFLLKNAYSFAFYSLKKENMNWPFSTETPFTFETAKIGFNIRF